MEMSCLEGDMNTVEYDFLKAVSGGEITSSSNPIEVIKFVRLGIKATAIYQLGAKLKWEPAAIAKVIGTTTMSLERHRKNKTPFSLSVSENVIELAMLSTIGIDYFGNIARWNLWLNAAHVQFDNQSPYSFMHTIRGRELIKRTILGLEYGLTA